MKPYTQEEAQELFDKLSDLFQNKPLQLVLEMVINTLRNCLAAANNEQRAIIMVTLLENLGIEEDLDPETTIQ